MRDLSSLLVLGQSIRVVERVIWEVGRLSRSSNHRWSSRRRLEMPRTTDNCYQRSLPTSTFSAMMSSLSIDSFFEGGCNCNEMPCVNVMKVLVAA